MAFTRRAALVGAGAVAGAAAMRWLGPQNPVLAGTGAMQAKAGNAVLNDASRLDATPVFRHVVLSDDPGEALVEKLRAELREAAAEGRAVNIGAARHSMGCHAIPHGGQALTLDSRFLEADTAARVYRVQAGVRWNQAIAALDPIGYSPKVMQSNADFGVAATFSVNAHGWPVTHGPMGSTVREVTMVLADGSLVTCSRDNEPALFRAAMGGYGLVGLITEMVVEMMPNTKLDPRFETMPARDFAARFAAVRGERSVEMAYGRLNVDREAMFTEAMLVSYRTSADQADAGAPGESGWLSRAARPIFRAQLGNEAVKQARWWVETGPGAALARPATRNVLMGEPVATLDDGDPARTDILHEYFVPEGKFAEFAGMAARVIGESYQELLNVTLRFVDGDAESMLAYAPAPRIAAVMLFSQEMTQRAEADMSRMTRGLIDGVLALGGSYYLPYRPHATAVQFQAGYPKAAEFAALKRQLDPGLVLRNGFWNNYLASI